MKIAILNKSDLSAASFYDAAEPQQRSYGGPWGDPTQTIHVAIPAGFDHRAAKFAWSEDRLSIEVTEDSALKTELQQQDAVESVQVAVTKAIVFGQKLIAQFATENVLLGITQDGKTGEVLDKMQPVMTALQSGSLYEAKARALAIPTANYDAKYITHARIMRFVNKIEEHLGLPLSL